MALSLYTTVLARTLLAVVYISSFPVLGSIPKDMSTPDSFTRAVLDRYGSGGSLTVQGLQVLLRNASSCPAGTRLCSGREGAACAPPQDSCSSTCMSATEVLQIHNMSADSELNATGLREVCPTLLYNLDRTNGCQSRGENSTESEEHGGSGRPSPVEVWGYGILSVSVISLCSVMGAIVVPFMKKRLYTLLLTFLIALAVGALSGSALFHLIPQAFDLPPEEYTEKAAAIWAGIYLFFITERLLKMASKLRQKRKARKYAQQTGKELRADVAVCAVRARTLSHVDPHITEPPRHHGHSHGHVFHNPDRDSTEDSSTEDRESQKKRSCCRALCSNTDTIATVAWMVIFGDGLHNLMDGLAIGASFQVSVFSGISTSLAVLCEEFPHELGDFAILLNAGMSVRQAMFYNFLSACSCFAGLVVGIVVGDNSQVGQWIFGLAGGMFLYISLVDMMPEMNAVDEDEKKGQEKSQDMEEKSSSLLRFFLQNLGLLVGFAVMLVLAKFPFEI
ncbi:PREDICTED: zinc transporter ZIP14-like [Branchiostoma belcheri]|uniref:Zinc transporter ZIP14-like n=1 Tax=Branchiostoma belcheri TaxID=7741 RepID=A0A6P5A2Q6_BRABE|nr:PREDICTED: zinc transporter ZIP14-like [Branchiostoma belcheri]